MRLPRLFCGVLIFLLAGSQSVQSVRAQDAYSVDNSHTSIVFAVSHMGLSYTYGRFNDCTGSIVLDLQKPEDCQFEFEIDVNSIDTNQAERDKHLKGPDFFDAAEYPTIKFRSVRVTKSELPYEEMGIRKTKTVFNAIGDITMRGQTREIQLPLQLIAIGRGSDDKQRCGFFSKFVVKRSDFGMDAMTNLVGDQIAITFSFEGVVKEPEEKTDLEVKSGPLKSLDSPFDSLGSPTSEDKETSLEIKEDEPSSPFDAFGEGG